MSQEFTELERSLGYSFSNKSNLRRALTCQSAINEWHSNASEQNFQVFEFLGDAALKYSVATMLYFARNDIKSSGDYHEKTLPYINNTNLTRIGRELNLQRYIITGQGVTITDKMLGDAVEAILGAIIIDQRQQGNSAENVCFDVVSRLFSISRKTFLLSSPNITQKQNSACCPCCQCCCSFCGGFIFAIVLMIILVVIGHFLDFF